MPTISADRLPLKSCVTSAPVVVTARTWPCRAPHHTRETTWVSCHGTPRRTPGQRWARPGRNRGSGAASPPGQISAWGRYQELLWSIQTQPSGDDCRLTHFCDCSSPFTFYLPNWYERLVG